MNDLQYFSAQLISIQIGKVQDLTLVSNSKQSPARVVQSAINKTPIDGPVEVNEYGIIGDQQADRKLHGGIDKAILCYCSDHFAYWADKANREVKPGAFGENLTIQGAKEKDLCIGDRLSIGDCELEVSQPRQPCLKLSAHWQESQMVRWVSQVGYTGWYCRVTKPGNIASGSAIEIIERPNPSWSIDRANQMMYGQIIDATAMAELFQLPQLSHAWKKDLG
jgi:MOSC domain-containing protein YiiM